MYNRKFNIHTDFHSLVELEHEIMPMIRKIQDEEEREKLYRYIRKVYENQWKKITHKKQ